MDRSKLEKSIQEVEEETKNFLRSRKGLQYLRVKYPNYTLKDAVQEYRYQVWIAEQYS